MAKITLVGLHLER